MRPGPYVRAGLTILPWTLPDPERGSPNGAFHCPTCLETTSPMQREGMHCGWIDRSRWTPDMEGLPKMIGPDAYTADICPGALVRDPRVVEGAQAYAALEAGILDRHDPLGLRVVTQMALCLKRAMNNFEAARMKQLARRAG